MSTTVTRDRFPKVIPMGTAIAAVKHGLKERIGKMIYQTKGTCSKEIHIEIENDVIQSVKFVKGCPGLTQALERMLVDVRVEDAIRKLDGIQCLDKGTSCPDQLAKALKQYASEKEGN